MKFREGAHVVLLRGIRPIPAGTHGIVKRDTGRVTILALDDGRIVSVKSDLLGNESQEPITKGET